MGLNTAQAKEERVESDEDRLGLPSQPEYDQGKIRSAISDANSVEKYLAKALEALENEDYESVKGYLQDIETCTTSAASTLISLEEGLSKFEEWGDAWKQYALDQPTEVIDMLDAVYRPCLEQIVEIQAEEGLTADLADFKSDVAIRSWGIQDTELIAVILAVSKIRGEELRRNRKGPQPVVTTEAKIRKITGEQRRSFF